MSFYYRPRVYLGGSSGGGSTGGHTVSGVVTLDGKKWRDDNGPFNPRGISFFTLPWGLKHEEDRYRENLTWVRKYGFDFVRYWGKVGGQSWEDREFSVERDPDAMAHAIDVAYEQYGLRSDIALIADNYDGADPVGAAHALAGVMRERRHKVICVECANEDNMPNEDENLRRVFDVLRDAFPDLPIVARSAPEMVEEDRSALEAYPYANVMSAHPERQPPPERQIRAIWGGVEHGRAKGIFEPAGPWSSSATQDDPMHLSLSSALSGISGFGLYVFHAGAGIRHGGAWDRNRGLPANYWDQSQADEQARAVMVGSSLLPSDAADWTPINGHWQNHPMPMRWVWSDGWPEGISRQYAIEKEGQFLNAVLAVKGRSEHPILRDCAIEVFDPRTGELVDTQVLRGGAVYHSQVDGKREITGDGETYTLRGPEVGGLWGYIVKGRYR